MCRPTESGSRSAEASVETVKKGVSGLEIG